MSRSNEDADVDFVFRHIRLSSRPASASAIRLYLTLADGGFPFFTGANPDTSR